MEAPSVMGMAMRIRVERMCLDLFGFFLAPRGMYSFRFLKRNAMTTPSAMASETVTPSSSPAAPY